MIADRLRQMEVSEKKPFKRFLKRARFRFLHRYIEEVQKELSILQNRDRFLENENHKQELEINQLKEKLGVDYGMFDYATFEERFRGSRDSISKRQREYLPYLKDCRHVVDVGCGRGEFVELLVNEGIAASGVDLYAPYVEHAKKRGLNVCCDDGIAYLKKSEGVDAVTAMQVVEHLTTNKLIELIRTAYEKLNSGGLLIMETPNPMSLYIFSHAFYIDPTHNKPIHPYFLQYLAQMVGFEKVEILFTESSRPVVNERISICYEVDKSAVSPELAAKTMDMLYGSQDYAVIARKGKVARGFFADQHHSDMVYSEIYDIASENVKPKGTTLPVSRSFFMMNIKMPEGVFDVARAMDLNNYDFMRLAYRKLFSRIPGEKDYESWEEQLGWEPERFQPYFVRALINSEELKLNRTKIINNPFGL